MFNDFKFEFRLTLKKPLTVSRDDTSSAVKLTCVCPTTANEPPTTRSMGISIFCVKSSAPVAPSIRTSPPVSVSSSASNFVTKRDSRKTSSPPNRRKPLRLIDRTNVLPSTMTFSSKKPSESSVDGSQVLVTSAGIKVAIVHALVSLEGHAHALDALRALTGDTSVATRASTRIRVPKRAPRGVIGGEMVVIESFALMFEFQNPIELLLLMFYWYRRPYLALVLFFPRFFSFSSKDH
mmetsp:Transcript_6455/g.26146  ORF Transcript_6455/g.26146 Transcript_6455/m.26146 type:complete len:237 (+) Transcript_6455:4953-5663(+)